jgi:transcriptional regulator with XRE-family HTH domain
MIRNNGTPGGIVDDLIQIINAELKRRDWTISDLAERAECNRPYTSRVLSGQKNPTLEWVQKIAKPLGISVRFEKNG